MKGRYVGALAGLLVWACNAELPRPVYVQQPTTALVVVPYPPPPARAEIVPPQPDGQAVWLDGEWEWRRRRWGWKLGRWVVPPPGSRFSPWTAVRNDVGTLYFAPGVWRDAHGDVIPEAKALAVGGVSGGAVVDSEGTIEMTGPNSAPDRSARRKSPAPPVDGAPSTDGGS